MALNGITINRGQGGLGRPADGVDHISALLFYSGATLPSGFSSSDRVKTVYSVQDAINLGITDGHLGETVAVAKFAVGGTPAAGDTVKITYTGIEGLETVLSTYTLTTADAVSTTTAAAALAAQINLLTPSNGFSATSSTANLFINTKGGEGVFPNSGTPYAATVTGGTTITITQPTGSGSTVLGVCSDIDIQYYHISEFFRLQPKGKLYVGIYATADVGTFANVADMQNFAQGEIKQMGVYFKSTSFATSQCNALQSQVTALKALDKPIASVILAGEISGTAAVSSIATNLRSLSDPNISVTIGQDGAATGNHIFKATGKSITNLGEMLGAVALSKVSESIAWIGKYQVASGELDTIAFANGELCKNVSDGTITNLDTYGFCFLRSVYGRTGAFHNRPYTCVANTSDYGFIYSNRTIEKAILNVRGTLLPALGSSVKVASDGTLSQDAINYFKTLAENGLDVLIRAQELSDYSVLIDPDQDVLATNEIIVTCQLLPLGTADFITVNIGFTNTLSTN